MKKKVCLLTVLVGLLSVHVFAQVTVQTIPGLSDQIKALADQIKLLAAPLPPPLVPVDCTVTPWSLQSAEDWLACGSTGEQTRLEHWIRTIITPPLNGGAACPALNEVRQATQACTPPPPPPPPPSGFVLRTAMNTGLAGAGIAEASLVTTPGATYGTAFSGQTITGKRFTGRVNITGSNITISGCLFNPPSGSGLWLVDVTGAGTVIKDSTFRPQSGSQFIGIIVEGGSLLASSVNIAGFENNMSIYGGSVTIERSYLHDPSNASNPGGHVDGIEIYGGSNHVLRESTITTKTNGAVSPINIAPWSGGTSVANVLIADNYLDGGNTHALVDLQSSGSIRLVRFLRNRLGGHTASTFGSYAAFLNSDNRAFVETEARLQAAPNGILWPTVGADVNVWWFTKGNPFGYSDLTPDKAGQTVTP